MFLKSIGQIKTTALAVGTSAVRLASNDVVCGGALGRHTIEVCNPTGSIVYIGDKSVSVATGVPVYAKSNKIIPVGSKAVETLYVVAGASLEIVLAEYFD